MEPKKEEKRAQNPFWKRLFKEQPPIENQAPVLPEIVQPPEPRMEAPVEEMHPPVSAGLAVEEGSALWRLWDQWRQLGDPHAPVPRIELEDGENPAMTLALSEAELQWELSQLAQSLEAFCVQRLNRLGGNGEAAVSLDTGYFVHGSRNKMAAWALAVPPYGHGGGPDFNKLGEPMLQMGINTGIDHANIGWLSSPEGHFFQLRIVARGVPVVEGKDGSTAEYFQRQMVQKVEMDENGNVDYRAQCYFQAVCKGDIICDILLPEEGIAGVGVDGQPIPPRPVRPVTPPKGVNINLSPDQTQLVAAMDGHVEFQGGVFQVRPTLTVNGDVDYGTGNIVFRGDVHITGDVRENFVVRATGKVTIDGLVEGATVEADGDIVISKGVLGNNKALVKSKKLVRAKYLENCVVYSGDCTYADCIINSQIFSDSKINVTTGRGTVIGGCLTAAEQIQCIVIGSQSGRGTEIILGQLPYIQEEMRDNDISLLSIQEECRKLDETLKEFEGRRGSDEEEKELSLARLRRSVLALKEDRLWRRQDELKATQLDLGKCRLLCDTIHPITRVTIGTDFRSLENTWKKCTIYYNLDTREIVIS